MNFNFNVKIPLKYAVIAAGVVILAIGLKMNSNIEIGKIL